MVKCTAKIGPLLNFFFEKLIFFIFSGWLFSIWDPPGLGILQDFFEQLTAGFWRFVLFSPMPAIFGDRTGIVLIGRTVGTNRQPVPNDSIHLFLILAFFFNLFRL